MLQAIQGMIKTTPQEMASFLAACSVKQFKRNEVLATAGRTPAAVFFVNQGLIRVFALDQEGREHTIHFALAGRFIADYAAFLQQIPACYTLEALEPTEVVVVPRQAIEQGYRDLPEGQQLGRLIAEYYFIYQDQRIKDLITLSPAARYAALDEVFPTLTNRVPQHLIASYLGITSVHLSRVKSRQARTSR